MGINFFAKLAKNSLHQSKFGISSNSICGSKFVDQMLQCKRYCVGTTNAAVDAGAGAGVIATKIPKSQFFPFPIFFRKSVSSTECSKTQMGFLVWYLGLLESKPIITKSISSAIIYAASDVTSQMITMSPSDSIDIIRTLRMAGFGLIILGTAQHLWFNFMGSVLPKRDVVSTLKKLLIGQFVYGPVINSAFFSFNAALQGENGEEIAARLNRDLLPTMVKGLMYWPMCDFLTYKVVPLHLQPLVNSSFSYAWTIYLTYVASLKKAAD